MITMLAPAKPASRRRETLVEIRLIGGADGIILGLISEFGSIGHRFYLEFFSSRREFQPPAR